MAQVATSALPAKILQTIHFLHGPKVFGGRGLSGIEDLDGSRLEEAIKLIEVRLKVLSGNLGVAAYVNTSESSSSISGSRL
jgi:riboflavin biosynthesis pyrimidine reductase